MAEYNLRSSHVSCLYYLYSGEGLTATDLCERCAEDKATISRALEYLETNGYLTRQSRTPKYYRSTLTLTEKGVAVSRKISEKINGVLDEISGELTEEERVEFYRSLTIISNSLDAVARR
jgi:DNA-binding MarR family transcriptional regulator